MTRRLSSSSLEDPEISVVRNGQPSSLPPSHVLSRSREDISKRNSDKRWESSESLLSETIDETDSEQTVAKPATAKIPPVADVGGSQPTRLSHAYHSSGGAKSPSARTSTASLQALSENTVVDARSDPSALSRTVLPQRMIHRPANPNPSESSRAVRIDSNGDSRGQPVYPNQSYAVLQSQVHPTYHHQRGLRPRSSYPSRIDTSSWFSETRASRTAGNTPVSSPGLFSVKTSTSTTPSGSEDENRFGSPFLHPTHLQPPKE